MTTSLTAKRRTLNRAKAITLTVAGLVLTAVAAGGILAHRATSATIADLLQPKAEAAPAAGVSACRALLRRAGAVDVAAKAGGLRVNAPLPSDSLADVESTIYRLSLAVSQCGYSLSSFCAGPACDGAGISFELLTDPPKKAPAS